MGDSSTISNETIRAEISPITESVDETGTVESPHSRNIRNIIDLISDSGIDAWEGRPMDIEIPNPELTEMSPRTPLAPRNPSHINIFHTVSPVESDEPSPNVFRTLAPLRLDFSTY